MITMFEDIKSRIIEAETVEEAVGLYRKGPFKITAYSNKVARGMIQTTSSSGNITKNEVENV